MCDLFIRKSHELAYLLLFCEWVLWFLVEIKRTAEILMNGISFNRLTNARIEFPISFTFWWAIKIILRIKETKDRPGQWMDFLAVCDDDKATVSNYFWVRRIICMHK